MAKVGVVLSGCGVMDGSEIHESVLILLALAKAGAQAICMAPALMAKIFEGSGVELTIGNDNATAQAIENLGPGPRSPCSHSATRSRLRI